MEERRRFVRLDVYLDVSYSVLPDSQPRYSVTKDVGAGGFCLVTDEPLKPGTRLQVSLKLPERGTPVVCVGEVAWSEAYEIVTKTGSRRSVETGVRFIEIAAEDREVVMRHVILKLQPTRRPPPIVPPSRS